MLFYWGYNSTDFLKKIPFFGLNTLKCFFGRACGAREMQDTYLWPGTRQKASVREPVRLVQYRLFIKTLSICFYSCEDVRGQKTHIVRLKSGVRLKVVVNVKYFQFFKLWTLTVSSWLKYVLWLCSTSTKYKNLIMFEIRKIFFARACGARDTVHLRFGCGRNGNLAFVCSHSRSAR